MNFINSIFIVGCVVIFTVMVIIGSVLKGVHHDSIVCSREGYSFSTVVDACVDKVHHRFVRVPNSIDTVIESRYSSNGKKICDGNWVSINRGVNGKIIYTCANAHQISVLDLSLYTN